MDVNVIGFLNELLQSENYEKIPFVDEDCGGPDHAKNWKSKIDLIYKNVDYSVESDVFSNKKDARRDAALKMLKEIGYFTDAGNDDYKPITKNPNQNIPARATQSLVQEEIIFTKTSQIMTDRKSIQISSNTCESLIDWALRKSEKKPFSMLLLLSARTDDVKGSAWYASIPQGELTMLNVQLGDNHFFEMGLGVSKSKSRKDAARKIIENSKIFEWLENQYGVNRTI